MQVEDPNNDNHPKQPSSSNISTSLLVYNNTKLKVQNQELRHEIHSLKDELQKVKIEKDEALNSCELLLREICTLRRRRRCCCQALDDSISGGDGCELLLDSLLHSPYGGGSDESRSTTRLSLSSIVDSIVSSGNSNNYKVSIREDKEEEDVSNRSNYSIKEDNDKVSSRGNNTLLATNDNSIKQGEWWFLVVVVVPGSWYLVPNDGVVLVCCRWAVN